MREVEGRAPGPVLARLHYRHRGVFEATSMAAGASVAAVVLGDGEPWHLVASGFGGAGLVALLLLISSEVRGTTEETLRSAKNVYSQLEALLWLRDLLQVSYPLRPMRGFAAGPDFLLELVRVVDERKPKLVVELGSGVSTVVISARLKGVGRVVSLEHDAGFAGLTREELARQELDGEVVHAPLAPVLVGGKTWQWYQVPPGLDAIDVLVVDGPPASTGALARYPALPLLASRLSPGAVVLVDDAARGDEREMVERWLGEHTGFQARYVNTENGACVITRTGDQ
jgi:predicted O-methyltransferase YrrM